MVLTKDGEMAGDINPMCLIGKYIDKESLFIQGPCLRASHAFACQYRSVTTQSHMGNIITKTAFNNSSCGCYEKIAVSVPEEEREITQKKVTPFHLEILQKS